MFINPVLSPKEGYNKSELTANKPTMESPLVLSGKIVSTKEVMDTGDAVCEIYLGMLDDEDYPQVLHDIFEIFTENGEQVGTVSFKLDRRRLFIIDKLTWTREFDEEQVLSTDIRIEIK